MKKTTEGIDFLALRRKAFKHVQEIFFTVADIALGRQGLLESSDSEIPAEAGTQDIELFYANVCSNFAKSADLVITSFFEFSFLQTKNPCYVWQAISYCKSNPNQRFDLLELLASSKLEYQKKTSPDREHLFDFFYAVCAKELPLPDWCISYIAKCADDVTDLCNSDENIITRQNCVEKIPNIFGFTRKGWNAFDGLSRDRESDALLDKFDILVFDDGLSKTQARKALLEEYGRSDDRNLKRALLRRVPYRVAKPKA